jgi:hypothetical protein
MNTCKKEPTISIHLFISIRTPQIEYLYILYYRGGEFEITFDGVIPNVSIGDTIIWFCHFP